MSDAMNSSSEMTLSGLRAALARVQARMDVLVDTSPVGIFFDDADDKCVFVNRTFCEMTGLDPAQAMGDGWARTVHPDDLGRLMAERAEAVGTGAPVFRAEYRYQRENGTSGWVEEQTRPAFGPGGELLGYVGILVEISARKEEERMRDAYSAELEVRVRERTAELEAQTVRLAEMNAALKVLLRQRDEDREELELAVLTNVRRRVAPAVDRLEAACPSGSSRQLLQEVRQALQELTSPFSHRLSVVCRALTPAEIQVADLIRQGLATKEIATRLGVGTSTIDSHRHHIRRKLGLESRIVGLRAYLLSLDPV